MLPLCYPLRLYTPPSNLRYPGDSSVTLVVPSYRNVSLVNSSPNLSKKNFKIIVSNHHILSSCWFDHDMTVLEIHSQQNTTTILTLVEPTKLAHVLRSLFYRRLLSTQVRPLKSTYKRSCIPRIFFTFTQSSIHFPVVLVIS